MRKILQILLTRPLTWIGARIAASPDRELVFNSLTEIHNETKIRKSSRVKIIEADLNNDRFIIFSDQHKGNGSWADDFAACQKNYCAALDIYNKQKFTFINLGDSEELWKFKVKDIVEKNKEVFEKEAAFQPHRYIKTFGNHDLLWKNKLDVQFNLRNIFQMPLPVYEAILLCDKKLDLDIMLTHGHQGDKLSDNNSLSTWIVAHLWMPLQRYLRININTPSSEYSLRNRHNKLMYEWSSTTKNLLLITGHTHQPIFASGKYYRHPSNNIPGAPSAEKVVPVYFNSGCCCFNDGDITGIEIKDGKIMLVKWYNEEIRSEKKVLEEITFITLKKDMQN